MSFHIVEIDALMMIDLISRSFSHELLKMRLIRFVCVLAALSCFLFVPSKSTFA